jgi:hypothetical protein
MARGAKQSGEFGLRLWRRGGPVRSGAKGAWLFDIPAQRMTLPVLWREYGWACELKLAGRKRRATRVGRSAMSRESGGNALNFDCSALTAPLVPLCAFGLEMTKSASLSWL